MSGKILFLSSHHGSGAAESLWLETAEHLAKEGHPVAAAINWARINESRLQPLKNAGVHPVHLFRPSLPWRLYRKFRGPGKAELRMARKLAGPGGNTSLVLVSQGNDHSCLPWLESFQALQIPTCVVTHGIIASDWPSDVVSERLKMVFEAAVASFWVSKRNQTDFEHQIGSRLASGEVVWNPVKVTERSPLAWPNHDDTLRMACVARLQVRPKGHDLLLQALALPHWRERPLHLSFFGTGENRKGLAKLARLLNIADRVTFHGHVEDVRNIWANHHLIAQPSRNEGMPLSLVEALICGRPALATDVAGHAELITEGVNGFMAEAPTVRHLDEALQRAWEQRQKWEEMGRLASARILHDMPTDPVKAFAQRLKQLAN